MKQDGVGERRDETSPETGSGEIVGLVSGAGTVTLTYGLVAAAVTTTS